MDTSFFNVPGRRPSTARNGEAFSESDLDLVWSLGSAIAGFDPARWRRDKCGAAIDRKEYGNTNSQYGWEVDHIRPVASGGRTEVNNVQPLQWQNNRRKGDTYPWSPYQIV